MKGRDASSDVLRREIREQSEAEAASLVEGAEKEAQRIVSGAETEAGKVRAEILKKAEVQAEGIRRRVLSGVHLEIKRQTLRAREEMLAEILNSVKFRDAGIYELRSRTSKTELFEYLVTASKG